MREICSIELVLENCEAIEIKREYIGCFYIGNINRSISRIASNSISDHLTCDEVFLEISSKANKTPSFVTDWSLVNEMKPFDRLRKYNDIVAINVKYKDGSEEYIYVKWNDESEYENNYQTSAINPKTGDLFIAISKDHNVKSYFEKMLEVDNSDNWNLYS